MHFLQGGGFIDLGSVSLAAHSTIGVVDVSVAVMEPFENVSYLVPQLIDSNNSSVLADALRTPVAYYLPTSALLWVGAINGSSSAHLTSSTAAMIETTLVNCTVLLGVNSTRAQLWMTAGDDPAASASSGFNLPMTNANSIQAGLVAMIHVAGDATGWLMNATAAPSVTVQLWGAFVSIGGALSNSNILVDGGDVMNAATNNNNTISSTQAASFLTVGHAFAAFVAAMSISNTAMTLQNIHTLTVKGGAMMSVGSVSSNNLSIVTDMVATINIGVDGFSARVFAFWLIGVASSDTSTPIQNRRLLFSCSGSSDSKSCNVTVGTGGGGILQDSGNMAGTEVIVHNASLAYIATGPLPTSSRPIVSLFNYGYAPSDVSGVVSLIIAGALSSFTVTGSSSQTLYVWYLPNNLVQNLCMVFRDGAQVSLASVYIHMASMNPSSTNVSWVVRDANTSLNINGMASWMTGVFSSGASLNNITWMIADGAYVSLVGPLLGASMFKASSIQNCALRVWSGARLTISGDLQVWYPLSTLSSLIMADLRASSPFQHNSSSTSNNAAPSLMMANSARLLFTDVEISSNSGVGAQQDASILCDMFTLASGNTTAVTDEVVIQLLSASTLMQLFSSPRSIAFVFTNGCAVSVTSAKLFSTYALNDFTLTLSNRSHLKGLAPFGGYVMESLSRLDGQLTVLVDNSTIELYGNTNLLSISRPGVTQTTRAVVVRVLRQSMLMLDSSNVSTVAPTGVAPPCGLVTGWNSNLTNTTVVVDDSIIVATGPRVWLVSTAYTVSTSGVFGLGWATNVSLSLSRVVWNGTGCVSNRIFSVSSACARATTIVVRNSTLLSSAVLMSANSVVIPAGLVPPNDVNGAESSWLQLGFVPLLGAATVTVVYTTIDAGELVAGSVGVVVPTPFPVGLLLNATVPLVLWSITGSTSPNNSGASSALKITLEGNVFPSSPIMRIAAVANSEWLAISATGASLPVTATTIANGATSSVVSLNMTSCSSNALRRNLSENATSRPLRMKTELIYPLSPVLHRLVYVNAGSGSDGGGGAATIAGFPPSWCFVAFTTSQPFTLTKSRRNVTQTFSHAITATVPIPVFFPPPVVTTPLNGATNAVTTSTVASSLVVSSVIPRPAMGAALVQLSSSALACAAAAANAQAAQDALFAYSTLQNQPIGALVMTPSGQHEDPIALMQQSDDFSSGVADNPLQLRIALAFRINATTSTTRNNNMSLSDLTFLNWQEGAENAAGAIVGNVFIIWPVYIAVVMMITYYRCRHHEALNPTPTMVAGATGKRDRKHLRQKTAGSSHEEGLLDKQHAKDKDETMEERGERQKSMTYAMIPGLLRPLAGKIQYVALRSNFPGAFVVPYALLVQPTITAATGLTGRCGDAALPGSACFLGLVGLAFCFLPFFVGLYLVVGICGRARWGAEWRTVQPFRAVAITTNAAQIRAVVPSVTDFLSNPRQVAITYAQAQWKEWSTERHKWAEQQSSDANHGGPQDHSSGVHGEDDVDDGDNLAASVSKLSFLARVSLVEPYLPGREWFLFIELGGMLASGIPIGAAWAAGGTDCDASLWIVFVVATLGTLAVVILKPYATMIETIWSAIMGALTVIVTLCLVTGDTEAADGIALAQAIASILPVLRQIPKVVITIMKGVVHAQGALKRKLRRRNIEVKRQQQLERRRRENEHLKQAFASSDFVGDGATTPTGAAAALPPTDLSRFIQIPPEDHSSDLTDAEMASVLSSALPTPEVSPTRPASPIPRSILKTSPPQRTASQTNVTVVRRTRSPQQIPRSSQVEALSRRRTTQPGTGKRADAAAAAASAASAEAAAVFLANGELPRPTRELDPQDIARHQEKDDHAITEDQEVLQLQRDVEAIKLRRSKKASVDAGRTNVQEARDQERNLQNPVVAITTTLSPKRSPTFRDLSAHAAAAVPSGGGGSTPHIDSPSLSSPSPPSRGRRLFGDTSPPQPSPSPPPPLVQRATTEMRYHDLMLLALDICRKNHPRRRAAPMSSFQQRSNMKMLLDLVQATKDKSGGSH